jgi:hypothetical protein
MLLKYHKTYRKPKSTLPAMKVRAFDLIPPKLLRIFTPLVKAGLLSPNVFPLIPTFSQREKEEEKKILRSSLEPSPSGRGQGEGEFNSPALVKGGSQRLGDSSRKAVRALATFCAILCAVWTSGCRPPTENPILLVSPTDYQTITVRYLNLAPALGASSLVLGNLASTAMVSTATVNFGELSVGIRPPSDSGFASVVRGEEPPLYRTQARLRFQTRGSIFTVVALQKLGGKTIDSLLVVPTTPRSDTTSSNSCTVRIINCYDDPAKAYNFALGCPSGALLQNTPVAYRVVGSSVSVPLDGSGQSAFTLLEQNTSGTVSAVKRTFTFNTQPRRFYNAFVFRVGDTTLALRIFDDGSGQAMMLTDAVQPKVFIRAAHFTSELPERLAYTPDLMTSDDILAKVRLSTFAQITVCGANSRDALTLRRANNSASQIIAASFGINRSYTLFTNDSTALIAESLPAVSGVGATSGSVRVRVVNLLSEAVSVFRGAQGSDPNTQLTVALAAGTISAPVAIPRPGRVPWIVFTAAQPQRLLQTGIADMPGNTASAYFLVIAPDVRVSGAAQRGTRQLYLIPDVPGTSQVPTTDLRPLNPSALVQAVSAFAGDSSAVADIGNVVQGAAFPAGAPLITVVETGEQQFSLGRAPAMYTVQEGKSVLAIGIGSGTMKQTIVQDGLLAANVKPDTKRFTYRYFNAAPDVQLVNITIPNFQSALSVPFGKFSEVRALESETRYEILFAKGGSTSSPGDTLRFQNLPLLFGKAYTILLTGTRGGEPAKNNLNAVLVQEY